MKLNILKDEGGELEIEFGGEGHTLLNLLQDSLLKDGDVEMAGYSKPHPLMDRTILTVTMRGGKSPDEALKRAAANAKGKLDEFLGEFEARVGEIKK